MPTEVRGAIKLRKALKEFTPDLAKEIQKELGALLKPVTTKARGFIPSSTPLSGWARSSETAKFPQFDSSAAKRGIGYKTTPSRPNRQGFRALARIVNASAAGAIYETAGRVNPSGSPKSRSNNPNAGKQFIDAMNATGHISGVKPKMQGRAIFRAWEEDGGKTNAAVIKAIVASRDKFYAKVGYRGR